MRFALWDLFQIGVSTVRIVVLLRSDHACLCHQRKYRVFLVKRLILLALAVGCILAELVKCSVLFEETTELGIIRNWAEVLGCPHTAWPVCLWENG